MTGHRARGVVALVICFACQVGCGGAPTDSTLASVNVAGTWSYAGSRSGQGTTTTGTLALTQDRTVRFNGTLDATELDPLGNVRRVIGVVSGRTVDDATIDFDIIVDPTVTRHHSGAVHGDSLTGTWVELSDQGIAASGSFRAHRVR